MLPIIFFQLQHCRMDKVPQLFYRQCHYMRRKYLSIGRQDITPVLQRSLRLLMGIRHVLQTIKWPT